MSGRGLLKKHFCKTFIEISVNDNFHFSHYKSMDTLRCHSNWSFFSSNLNKTIYVEDNVNIMYTKY